MPIQYIVYISTEKKRHFQGIYFRYDELVCEIESFFEDREKDNREFKMTIKGVHY